MNEKETKDIYYYVNEAYKMVVNKYLENDELDRDIDDIINKFSDIIFDICSEYIIYDDMAKKLLMDDTANLTDFAYCIDYYLGTELKFIDLIEKPRKCCNFYLTALLWYKLDDVLTNELEEKMEDFENQYRKMGKDLYSPEAKEHYRKMVTNTLLG